MNPMGTECRGRFLGEGRGGKRGQNCFCGLRSGGCTIGGGKRKLSIPGGSLFVSSAFPSCLLTCGKSHRSKDDTSYDLRIMLYVCLLELEDGSLKWSLDRVVRTFMLKSKEQRGRETTRARVTSGTHCRPFSTFLPLTHSRLLQLVLRKEQASSPS